MHPPRTVSATLAVAVLAVLPACSLLGQGSAPPQPVLLDAEEAPLQEAFTAGDGRVRLLAVLTPSCASCGRGVRALKTLVLDARSDVPVDVHLVWSGVLPSDSVDDVAAWMVELEHPRVHHYWDPALLVGHAYAELLDVEGSPFVWDTYMFFGPDARWQGDGPPSPHDDDWAHQMPNRGNGEHLETGVGLDAFFASRMARLVDRGASAEVAAP